MNDLVRQISIGRDDDHLVTPERVPRGDGGQDDQDEEWEQHIWRSVN
ncbi:hypothetical protein OG250_13765 [Streptomyces sp. NBC_00487]|nr:MULTISPECIES: hypothetical protein [unclassified Streptomyces]